MGEILCSSVRNTVMDAGFTAICASFLFILCFLLGVGMKLNRKMLFRRQWISNLANKHVLITGGSSGIGLAIAHQVIQQGGFITLISYRPSEFEEALKTLNCSPDRVLTKVADVGDYEEISKAVKESFEWRPFDVVVCNAGIRNKTAFLEELDVREVERVICTNLTGVVYTAHATIPLMKQRGKQCPQSLVLMGSMGSLHPIYGHCIYTASKHGLKGLAECLRLELLPFNIGVTLCCPDFTKTHLLKNVVGTDAKAASLYRIMKVVDLFDPSKLNEPMEVAKAALQSVKEGRFLVVVAANKLHELMFTSFCRGAYPAEYMGRTIMEIMVFLWFRLVKHKLWAHVEETIRHEHMKIASIAEYDKNDMEKKQ